MKILTKEEMAALLDGREYGDEINKGLREQAKESGLVVAYGASDDLLELDGALHDEADCSDGTLVRLHQGGVLPQHKDCECTHCGYDDIKDKCAIIETHWDKGDGYSWTYSAKIPHACFDVAEDDEKYCRGIVFNLSDLPKIEHLKS